ncbi:MAG: RNA 2',3'-cyclic phosphodiesterase, partial [Candidatus Omnitrophica bacterium]|nr:RNA 2',3'-cyclic phosphodiesterase [Candidatus Omnitrophota bacterium]
NITSIIDQTSRANSCFNLCLSELGAFPKLKYPRVIWVGITGEGPLIKISEELEKQALSIGLPPEIRAFNSHITLGRVRSGLNREALVEKLNLPGKAACFKNTEFKVSAITLFKSTLTPAGPIYEVISTSPLK